MESKLRISQPGRKALEAAPAAPAVKKSKEPQSSMLVQIGQVAADLGISTIDVQRLIARGRLPMVDVNGASRIRTSELAEFVAGNLSDLAIPKQLTFGIDYGATSDVKRILTEEAFSRYSPEILAVMLESKYTPAQRASNSPLPLVIALDAAPGRMLERLAQNQPGIFGPEPLKAQFLRGQLNRGSARHFGTKIVDPRLQLYQSEESYRQAVSAAVADVLSRVITGGKLLVLRVEKSRSDIGDESQIFFQKTQAKVEFTLPMGAITTEAELRAMLSAMT